MSCSRICRWRIWIFSNDSSSDAHRVSFSTRDVWSRFSSSSLFFVIISSSSRSDSTPFTWFYEFCYVIQYIIIEQIQIDSVSKSTCKLLFCRQYWSLTSCNLVVSTVSVWLHSCSWLLRREFWAVNSSISMFFSRSFCRIADSYGC